MQLLSVSLTNPEDAPGVRQGLVPYLGPTTSREVKERPIPEVNFLISPLLS